MVDVYWQLIQREWNSCMWTWLFQSLSSKCWKTCWSWGCSRSKLPFLLPVGVQSPHTYIYVTSVYMYFSLLLLVFLCNFSIFHSHKIFTCRCSQKSLCPCQRVMFLEWHLYYLKWNSFNRIYPKYWRSNDEKKPNIKIRTSRQCESPYFICLTMQNEDSLSFVFFILIGHKPIHTCIDIALRWWVALCFSVLLTMIQIQTLLRKDCLISFFILLMITMAL